MCPLPCKHRSIGVIRRAQPIHLIIRPLSVVPIAVAEGEAAVATARVVHPVAGVSVPIRILARAFPIAHVVRPCPCVLV